MRSLAIPALAFACAAPVAQAKTEVELVFDLLTYSDTVTEKSSDDVSVDTKDTDLKTLGEAIDLNIYADKIGLRFELDATGGDSGAIQLGYEMSPNIYIGGVFDLQNQKDNTDTKPDGGEKSSVKSEKNSMAIGPFVHYRDKKSDQLIEAQGTLAMVNTKTKTTTDPAAGASTETTDKTESMVLALGGNYRKKVWDRVYMGPGLGFAMSLSGDAESDDGTSTTDYDYDIRVLQLTLVDMLVEF